MFIYLYSQFSIYVCNFVVFKFFIAPKIFYYYFFYSSLLFTDESGLMTCSYIQCYKYLFLAKFTVQLGYIFLNLLGMNLHTVFSFNYSLLLAKE